MARIMDQEKLLAIAKIEARQSIVTEKVNVGKLFKSLCTEEQKFISYKIIENLFEPGLVQ